MEIAFWKARNEFVDNDCKQSHGAIEYINGVQYVYACNCSKCVVPDPFPGKKDLLAPWKYHHGHIPGCYDCDDDNCDIHDFILSKTSVSHEKKKVWNSRSRRRTQRKKEQKILKKLLATQNII